jgi:hypothetical protein
MLSVRVLCCSQKAVLYSKQARVWPCATPALGLGHQGANRENGPAPQLLCRVPPLPQKIAIAQPAERQHQQTVTVAVPAAGSSPHLARVQRGEAGQLLRLHDAVLLAPPYQHALQGLPRPQRLLSQLAHHTCHAARLVLDLQRDMN